MDISHWGIDPIPDEHKGFSGFDLGVLWADLGIGMLVIATGMLLVAPPSSFGTGLSLRAALLCIFIGSIVGSALLGIGGYIGTQRAVPTMAALRTVLGRRGSWIPTVLNAAQLLGWTAFELWAMALVADKLADKLFGFSSFGFWLVVFTAVTLGLGIWGPLGVVRAWMERFGAWLVLAIGAVVTVYMVTHAGSDVWSHKGASGGAIFGLPLDLVIAMPVSWLPLVADYNRFCRSERGSFLGTFVGYALANTWFYALGAVMFLVIPKTDPTPQGIAVGILSIGGVAITGILLLAGLLVGETDEAFADVYSTAISLRNIFANLDNRLLITVVTIAGAVLAGRLSMDAFETFLFLLGSVFIPLFGVWFADHFILRNVVEVEGIRWSALVPWIVGTLVYHWILPNGPGWWTGPVTKLIGTPLSSKFVWLGASLPSFAVAFILHAVIGKLRPMRQGKGSREKVGAGPA
ncbi:MAG: cytosine permease [Actinomycetota bacterium]|nr:cytosine permease [Actinomycetota bacterium]